ncbi:hypothetical protein CXB51_008275 [Gossypium anomalum]|uniref:DUF4218 domain-containing protein n=1 Tax=Gossypium anomalum TaxID=47600 RepID=A0A8J6DAI0_9ROSI|nr:hypothetical protein CXB51_008275 [Gossypium anomalum]
MDRSWMNLSRYVRQDDMEGMLRDAFNMHSHGEQPFPPDFIVSDDCNIGGNVFTETGTSALDEEPTEEAFLREMFPFAEIPQSCQDVKRLIKDLGLGYDKIHSCPNDCMLYWGDQKNQQSCHVCGKSHWMNRNTEDVNADKGGAQLRKRPVKRTLFDGTEEFREAPEQTIGSEILFMLKDMDFSYGKMNQPSNIQTKRRSRDESDDESDEEDDPNEADLWKKRIDMGIRHDLYPQVLPNGKYQLPPPIFTLSKEEKEVFYSVLKDIKVPNAYASNISRCVSLKDQRLYSLKSHDYHILMQDFLPLALRCCMSKKMTSCIIELSNIMKAICGKVMNVEELEKVQDQAALTLCNLEKIVPPSFFTIMVHLVIHLPCEAIIGGSVFYRWMYPIERFLFKLKSYCRNKHYPEGSIAEGYLAEECMTFCSRYLEDVETRLNRPSRNAGLNDPNLAETYLFQSYGEPIDKVENIELDERSWSGKDVNDEVKWLSQGPNRVVKRYSAFIINGFRFHTKYRERLRRTQNCGIVVNSSITSYASARDSNPVEGNVEYYGLLTDIIELNYYRKWKNTPNSEEANSEQQTVIGPSNVPDTLDKPAEFQTKSGGTRRGRGRTLLKDLYDLNPTEHVKVSKNSHSQSIKFEARLLAGYLDIIARNANMLPINYKSWHHMPDSNKNQGLNNIKERFALEVSDDYIKKASAFEITHRKKDGSPMTSEAGEIMEKLKEKKAEYEAIASTDSSVNIENIDNRIITEIWVLKGYGVTSTQYFGSNSQQYMPSGSQAQAEVQRLRDQIAQMQASTVEQIAEVQRKYEELQQQHRTDAAAREAATAVREAKASAMAAE